MIAAKEIFELRVTYIGRVSAKALINHRHWIIDDGSLSSSAFTTLGHS
jgi:hypothetical protein